MKTFDPLSSDKALYTSHLIEASAGTGKTFSVQHLFGRFLMEPNPKTGKVTPLREILVVTFTRAATDELFQRIQAHLLDLLEELTFWIETKQPPKYAYLEALEDPKLAKRRVEEALFRFEEAQVMTIHGFCSRILYGFSSTFSPVQNEPPESFFEEAVLDFCRTIKEGDWICPNQMKLLFAHFKNDLAKLGKFLEGHLEKGALLDAPPPFSEGAFTFQSLLSKLPRFNREDLESFFKLYRKFAYFHDGKGMDKLCEIQQIKGDIKEHFSRSLPVLIQLKKLIDKKEYRAKASPESHPLFPPFKELVEELSPFFDPLSLCALFAKKGASFLKGQLEQNGYFPPDTLLKKTLELCKDEAFCAFASSEYSVVVVDEFQDTDMVQWEIFRTLFDQKTLYLVGDPKQAIYSFRGADIYAYLKAKEDLKGEKGALNRNFRSTKNLTVALNALFHGERKGALLPLPKISSSFTIEEVEPARDEEGGPLPALNLYLSDEGEKTFDEQALNWFLTKANVLLQENGKLSDFAILVKDKIQAKSVQDFLSKRGVPYLSKKTKPIWETKAYEAMIALLDASLNPKSLSKLKYLLLTPLFGKNHEDLRDMEDNGELQEMLYRFSEIRPRLFHGGIASFIRAWMGQSPGGNFSSIPEFILSQNGGKAFLNEWRQLLNLAIDIQAKKGKRPERLLEELKKFPSLEDDKHSHLRVEQDGETNAVQILTLHSSKGLEFDYVLPIGLTKTFTFKNELVTWQEKLVSSSTNSQARESALLERGAENLRLLYVAFTRAKKGLFVPFFIKEKKNLKNESLTPADLFLILTLYPNLLISPSFLEEVEQLTPKLVEEALSKQLAGTDFSIDKELPKPFTAFQLEEAIPTLKAPVCPYRKKTSLVLQSFSSLPKPETSPEIKSREFPEDPVDHSLFLPPGRNTGTALHELLEKVRFHEGPQPGQVEKAVARTDLEPYALSIEAMLHNLLAYEIETGITSPIVLNKIPENLLWKEMEFIFPTKHQQHLSNAYLEKGFLKGFIDLIFAWEGKYFVLDWKSNFLGPKKEDYSKASLQKEMHEKNYFLQGAIYQEAVLKWLSQFGLEGQFGGVLFHFLRPYGLDENPHAYIFLGDQT